MKKIILKVSWIAITLIAIHGLSSCTQEDEFSEEGLVLLQIVDEFSGQPVSGASVNVYRTLDDWAFEENEVLSIEMGSESSVVLDNLNEGTYRFDVQLGNLNNWQNSYDIFIEDGRVNFVTEAISENLLGIISSVQGKTWNIIGIADAFENDLIEDPDYVCYLDNTYRFEKSGAITLNEGIDNCNSSGPTIQEGSWSGGYGYLFIHYIGSIDTHWTVTELTPTVFTITETGDVYFTYELLD